MKIIDGKMMQEEAKKNLAGYIKANELSPKLVIIQVGDNPSSDSYVGQKIKHSESIGIKVELTKLTSNVDTDDIIDVISRLNDTDSVDGIIVQLPLPEHIDERRVLDSIIVYKDVDGLSSMSIGLLHSQRSTYEPCTPSGIMSMFYKYNIPLTGKRCLVIGRSHIVGSPIQELLIQSDATVTTIHSKSNFDITEYGLYDIIIVAVGKRDFITDKEISYMKQDVVLIDVGINVYDNGKLCGDISKVLSEESMNKIGYLTPVPGGVGRTTVVELMKNVTIACATNKEIGESYNE